MTRHCSRAYGFNNIFLAGILFHQAIIDHPLHKRVVVGQLFNGCGKMVKKGVPAQFRFLNHPEELFQVFMLVANTRHYVDDLKKGV